MDAPTLQGLTSAEAQARLSRYGLSEPGARKHSPLAQILPLLGNPLALVLLVASGLSALLGEFVDASLIAGEIARRVGRLKLLAIVFLFFTSNLAIFALLARANVSIGLAFLLWVGLFSDTVVAQFWALAADIYSEEQGKRLFPVLGIGSSVGAAAVVP
jgi:MFS family permease